MRVKLKGINWTNKRLADGRTVTHYYAWRGGPRLEGEPGSPEFVASYERAYREQRKPEGETFKSIITAYMLSPDFTMLKDRTRSSYQRIIRLIEDAFGDLPIEALEDKRVSQDLLAWRDSMAATPCQADYAWRVLKLIISWARGRGFTAYRPPERVKPLYYGDRSDVIWEDQHIAWFIAVAPEPLKNALTMAAETGLRQGDLVVLPWSAYDPTPSPDAPSGWIRWTPSKTIDRWHPKGRPVRIPVTRRLRVLLDELWATRKGPIILLNSDGRPWNKSATLSTRFGAASDKAGIERLTFHDLRGTAVTRLSEAGCTPQEIRAITGHSLASIHRIFERYCARTNALASSAILKLERHRG